MGPNISRLHTLCTPWVAVRTPWVAIHTLWVAVQQPQGYGYIHGLMAAVDGQHRVLTPG